MKRVIAILLGAALLAAMLTGCGWSIHLGDGVSLVSGKDFTVNDHGEQDMTGIRRIEIGTVSDTVTLTAGGTLVTADLKGTCRATNKPVWLDMRMEGDTLRIEVKYPAMITNSNTSLAVSIPAEFAGDLTVNTVSGDIEAQNEPWKLGNVKLNTVSGGMDFSTTSAELIKAGTTSGDINLSSLGCRTEADTVSGHLELDFNKVSELSAGTISGSVDVRVPKDAAFSVDFSSTSGSFRASGTGLNVENAGKRFSGSTGTGGAELKVNTTSGDFTLQGK